MNAFTIHLRIAIYTCVRIIYCYEKKSILSNMTTCLKCTVLLLYNTAWTCTDERSISCVIFLTKNKHLTHNKNKINP